MLLDVKNLSTEFHTAHGIVSAVDDVSFLLEKGKTLGIVGESGSGKSVTCMSIMGLLPKNGKASHGSACFDGVDLLSLPESEMRKIRGSRISMIFQDPMSSLNPYLKISTQLTEPLMLHQSLSYKQALPHAITALEQVGIHDASSRIHSYPHEFSGGMRQRVMIAMALITKPELLICDEPTTALDVTVQRQVLDLIKARQAELNTAVIFISHDLAIVSEMCERIIVMYAGRIIESAPREELFKNPRHAYTRALLASIPSNKSKNTELFCIPGLPPTQASSGCSFQSRNTLGNASLCSASKPPLIEIAPQHYVQNCPGCLSVM